jgi:hypothetical protein
VRKKAEAKFLQIKKKHRRVICHLGFRLDRVSFPFFFQVPSHLEPPTLEEMLQQLQSFFGTLAGQSDRTLQDVADEEDLDVDEEVAWHAG